MTGDEVCGNVEEVAGLTPQHRRLQEPVASTTTALPVQDGLPTPVRYHALLAFAAQMLAFIAMPFLLLDSRGRTPLQAGALITAWPVATMAVAPIVERLIGRYTAGLLGGIGMAVMATGLALLAALPSDPANADIVWRMALCGMGFGMFQSPNNHTIVTSAPVNRSGAASGMLGTARLTGQTLGAVLLFIIFNLTSAHDARGPVIALALAAVFAVAAGAFSTLRMRQKPAASKP